MSDDYDYDNTVVTDTGAGSDGDLLERLRNLVELEEEINAEKKAFNADIRDRLAEVKEEKKGVLTMLKEGR